MTARFTIDPDITRAETLPASFYHSQDIYDELLERVLATSWQWIGHAGELAAGEARPAPLLSGSLDEPLLLARDPRGRLRCLSNVCTHRGNPLLSEPGPCQRLRCGYHGRTFGLDGAFEHMPAFEGARAGQPAFEAAQTLDAAGRRRAAYYYWLFPSTMLNFYPWGLSLNVVEPQGLERTHVLFHSYVWRPELLDQGAGGALDLVQREDEVVRDLP
jgi:nitrite reductase/ring-hydroxylating ferredoxin subunit